MIERFMQKFISLVLLFLSIFSASYAKNIRAYVVKVSDGDTIWVSTEDGRRFKVRIWGIDTPEKFDSGKLRKDAVRCNANIMTIKELGRIASKKAKELLAHSWITLEPKGRGYYGRVLGIVYLSDGSDYGLKMIKEGYACVYWKNHKKSYLMAQKEAEENNRGLWSMSHDLMECLCH